MAVADYIKPVAMHTTAPWLQNIHKTLRPDSPEAFIGMAQRAYEKLCGLIERGLRGEGVPTGDEEKAGEYVSHLLIDAAVLHNTLMNSHIFVGEFPYNDYAEKLFPKEEPPAAEDVEAQVLQ